jgi:hypothetical protein
MGAIIGLARLAAEQREAGSQQQVGIARNAGSAHRCEPFGDQLVGAPGVGRAQQRLGQAHERLALGAVERELLEHLVDQRPGALVRTGRLDPAGGPGAGADQRRLRDRKVSEQLLGCVRLRAQRRRAQLRTQRREVSPVVTHLLSRCSVHVRLPAMPS